MDEITFELAWQRAGEIGDYYQGFTDRQAAIDEATRLVSRDVGITRVSVFQYIGDDQLGMIGYVQEEY